MGPTPILLLVIVAIVLFWLDSARAREFATEIARRYCAARGLQFLDETVSQVRMGLRWTARGLRIRRMFRFDFSLEGLGRRSGHVLMLGSQLEILDDGLPREPTQTQEAQTQAPHHDGDDRKVVPFRRPRS